MMVTIVLLIFCLFLFLALFLLYRQLEKAKKELASLSTSKVLLEKTQSECEKAEQIIQSLRAENTNLSCLVAKEQAEKAQITDFLETRIKEIENLKVNMKDTLEMFSKKIVSDNSSLLSQAFGKTLEEFFNHSEREKKQSKEQISGVVHPLKESLTLVEKKIHDLEKLRTSAYSAIHEQIESLLKSQNHLAKETNSLRASLNAPSVIGRWGEVQLRRVVELSGLSAHCDFLEQVSLKDKEDTAARPDMIITLPRKRKVIVDAKTPIDGYIQAQKNGEASGLIASSLKRHIISLRKKSYTKYLTDSPEFIVMFLPAEAFLSRALNEDPSLIDFAAQNEVILATPLTLIAILKAVSFSLRQEAIVENVEEIKKLSKELMERIGKVKEHFDRLGKNLKNANEAFVQTEKSLESRVLVTARKLNELKPAKINEPDFEAYPLEDNLESCMQSNK